MDQGLDREAMPKIMKARTMARPRCPQSSSLREGVERTPNSAGFQRCSSSGYEKGRSGPSSQELGTMRRVIAEHSLGRRMNGHETRLAKLCTSNSKNAFC
jgi:hypothetical protein